MISGLSIVFNILAAYPVYMYLVGSKIGWLAILASGSIIANDIRHALKQTVGINNKIHFVGLGVGFWTTYLIRNYITTSTWRLPFGGPIVQFLVGAAWAACDYSQAALENYDI